MADPGDPVTEQPAKKEEGVEGAEVVETVPAGEADADTAVAKVEKQFRTSEYGMCLKPFFKDEYFKNCALRFNVVLTRDISAASFDLWTVNVGD